MKGMKKLVLESGGACQGRDLLSRLSASFTLAFKVNSVLFLFEKEEGLDEAEEQ